MESCDIKWKYKRVETSNNKKYSTEPISDLKLPKYPLTDNRKTQIYCIWKVFSPQFLLCSDLNFNTFRPKNLILTLKHLIWRYSSSSNFDLFLRCSTHFFWSSLHNHSKFDRWKTLCSMEVCIIIFEINISILIKTNNKL